MNKKGFTLVELIMVIVIIGLLAVVAIPRYFNLRDEARTAATDGVISAVRTGIVLYHSNQLVQNPDRDTHDSQNYPADLDGASGYFGAVLDEPIPEGGGWSKEGDYWESPDGRQWAYDPDRAPDDPVFYEHTPI